MRFELHVLKNIYKVKFTFRKIYVAYETLENIRYSCLRRSCGTHVRFLSAATSLRVAIVAETVGIRNAHNEHLVYSDLIHYLKRRAFENGVYAEGETAAARGGNRLRRANRRDAERPRRRPRARATRKYRCNRRRRAKEARKRRNCI